MHIDIHTHQNKSKVDVFSLSSLDIAEKTNIPESGYFSIGIHPWNNAENLHQLIEKLEELSEKERVLAIGECGLDRANGPELEKQTKFFIPQADISKKTEKPMILHSVRAYYDILKIRKDLNYKTPWIFHGFNGNIDTASEIISKGCYLSFGEIIFEPSEKLSEVIKSIPLQNIFLETDESKKPVREIYHRFADIRGIQPDELEDIVLSNFRKIFGNELV